MVNLGLAFFLKIRRRGYAGSIFLCGVVFRFNKFSLGFILFVLFVFLSSERVRGGLVGGEVEG